MVPIMADALELIPLGGLGEVGMNCMLIGDTKNGSTKRGVLLDCGVTFGDDSFGVDIIHPRFDAVVDLGIKVDALFITHAHEDHIGALPYWLRFCKERCIDVPPVYAPRYATLQMEARLEEFRDLASPEFRPLLRGQSVGVGRFEVEPFRVNHSIADAFGLIIRTPAGTVVHSGDFKIERDSTEAALFDRERLKALGVVDLLLSDSTNAHSHGRSGTEEQVTKAIIEECKNSKHRVVISQFASNTYRIAAAIRAARSTHRKLVILGRSLHRHRETAASLGFLDAHDACVVSAAEAKTLPRSELLVLATGSQGQPRAALNRLAKGEHRELTLERGDKVILSSRIIPGLEVTVHELIDRLERRGIEVVHRYTNPAIHVSGHACQEELRELIEMVSPRAFLPVHGTYSMLRKHASIAESMLVPSQVIDNGTRLRFEGGELTPVGHCYVGRVHYQRGDIVDDNQIKERGRLAEQGILVVAFPWDADRGLVGDVILDERGAFSSSPEQSDPVIFDELEDHITELLTEDDKLIELGLSDVNALESRLQKRLVRYLSKRHGRWPLVVVAATVVEDP